MNQAFKDWWAEVGSGLHAETDHDLEEHVYAVCEVAWGAALESQSQKIEVGPDAEELENFRLELNGGIAG